MTSQVDLIQLPELSNRGKVFPIIGLVLALPWERTSVIAMGLAGILVLAAFLITGTARIMRRTRARVQWAEEALTECQNRIAGLERQVTDAAVARDLACAARDEAWAARDAERALLADFGHELRTPLSTILGFADLLRSAPGLPYEHRQSLDIISRAGDHLSNLSEDLLNIGKMNAGCVAVKNMLCDLRRIVRDCVDILRARADAKNLELIIDEFPDFPRFVRCDAGKLRQVLINLLANAVEYTDSGRITLRANSQPLDNPQRRLLTFEVQDSGIGIGSDDQARVFVPFVKLSNASGRTGTGLGLSICRRLVEVMGGTIHLKSTPGRGSLFVVNVPVERAEKSAAEARQHESVVVLSGPEPDRVPLGAGYMSLLSAQSYPAVGELRREALTALPKQLRGELLDAVVRLESRSINEVIGRVSQHDAQLGTELLRCAGRSTYTPMFKALTNEEGPLSDHWSPTSSLSAPANA